MLIIITGGVILSLGDYQVTQEYAKSAAQQLNDDSAYVMMKSQGKINGLIKYAYWVLVLVSVYVVGSIWIPKKKKE